MDKEPSVQTGIPAWDSAINPVIGSSLAPAPEASANPLQIWIPVLGMSSSGITSFRAKTLALPLFWVSSDVCPYVHTAAPTRVS